MMEEMTIEGWGPTRMVNGGLKGPGPVEKLHIAPHRRQATLSGSHVPISCSSSRFTKERGSVDLGRMSDSLADPLGMQLQEWGGHVERLYMCCRVSLASKSHLSYMRSITS